MSGQARESSEEAWKPPVLREEQVWNLDHTLAAVAGQGIRMLRERDYGHPGSVTNEEWRDILDRMASGFEQYASAEVRSEDADMDALNTSLDLLRQWFPHLWD